MASTEHRSSSHPNRVPCRAGVASEPEYLSRKDVQHHLGISEKGVDRFIRDHALRSGSGRQVLVALDAYAACLVGLRRRSTRDTASVPARATDHSSFPPIEYRPGLDVIAALCFEQKAGEPADRRMHFLLQERVKAPPSTPEEMRRMAEWVGKAAFHLRPVAQCLAEHLKHSTKLFMDETRAPVLDPGRGRTKSGFLWALARDDRGWNGPDPPGVGVPVRTGTRKHPIRAISARLHRHPAGRACHPSEATVYLSQ